VLEASAKDWITSSGTYMPVNLTSYTPLSPNSNIVAGGGGGQPSNDNCSAAILLTSSRSTNYTLNQTVNNATPSGFPKANKDLYTGTPSLDDVWYYFQAVGTSTTITVNPNGSSLDAIIAAYSSCTNTTEINSSDTPGGNGALSTLTIPTSPGSFYYIRVYDYGGTNTTNGGFEIAVTHTAPSLPDLTVQNAQVSPSSVYMGLQVTASCSTINQGAGNAGTSVTSVWFSADQKFDGAPVDTYLGEIPVSALSAGQTSGTLSKQIIIPEGPYAGTWYIMFGADGAGAVNESNEANNQVFVPINFNAVTCTPPPPPTGTFGNTNSPGITTTTTPTLQWTATGASYDLYVSKYPYGGANLIPNQNQALVTCLSATSYSIPLS